MGAGAKLLIISTWSSIDPRLLQEEFINIPIISTIKHTITRNIKSVLVQLVYRKEFAMLDKTFQQKFQNRFSMKNVCKKNVITTVVDEELPPVLPVTCE
jgi:hypothetical protein